MTTDPVTPKHDKPLRPVERSEETEVYEALKQAREVPNHSGVLMCHWVRGRLVCHVQQKLKPTG